MELKTRRIAALAFAAALCPVYGRAHKRDFLDTYGYYTLERGGVELELFTDLRVPDSGRNRWFHQSEVEYGVTDRYTLGVYGVFVDGQGFTAWKLENKYRLSQPGQWPVDTTLYLEYKDANGAKDQNEIEAKAILSKDFGKWNLTANPILEFEQEEEPNGEKEWEAEPALALGTAYRTGGRLTPGIELLLAKRKTRLTPGLYIDILPEIRLNLGVGIGLEKPADDMQFKSLLELEF